MEISTTELVLNYISRVVLTISAFMPMILNVSTKPRDEEEHRLEWWTWPLCGSAALFMILLVVAGLMTWESGPDGIPLDHTRTAGFPGMLAELLLWFSPFFLGMAIASVMRASGIGERIRNFAARRADARAREKGR